MFVSQIIDEACEILATTDKTRVFRKLTQAVQTLMESGHYFHINAEVDVCTGWDGQTITLPRGIEVPLAVNVDGSPMYFRGRLFQYHVNKGGMYNPVGWAWDDRGFVSTVMDIRQPAQLVAVAEHTADAGLRIRVIGTDMNNRPLRTQTEDGVGVDGIYVPIHALTDFPYGTIAPDGVTIQSRELAITELTKWMAGSPHQLSSGERVQIKNSSGTFPAGVVEGNFYYVGKISDTELDLHQTKLDAIAGVNPIRLQSIVSAGNVSLTDARPSAMLTAVSMSSVPPVVIDTANEVTFSLHSGGAPALPSPLTSNATYFADSLDTQNLQIYGSIADASAGSNPILLTGNPGLFDVNLRKPMAPQTKLKLSTANTYTTGDIVEANTNGGVLPQPLIAGQNYYVHQVSGETDAITLHTSAADAVTGDNPITLITAGSGQNSIVKLLAATASPGKTNNISVSGFNLPTATGTGAQATALVAGPVTSSKIGNPGKGYVTAQATFNDAGGYRYTSIPTVVVAGGTYTTAAYVEAILGTDGATGIKYVSGFNIFTGGTGYDGSNPPTIQFIGGLGPGGFHAKAVPVISGGVIVAITLTPIGSGALADMSVNTITNQINGITITSTGTNYRYAPRISVSDPDQVVILTLTIVSAAAGSTLTNLTATANDQVSTYDLLDGGAPVSTAGSTSSIATAIAAAINARTYAGIFTASAATNVVSITTSLSIYDLSPTVTGSPVLTPYPVGITDMHRGTAKSEITTSFVTGYEISSGGSGYTIAPAVYISGGGGSGASAEAVFLSGSIQSISITSGGAGYPDGTYALDITDSTGPGVGATGYVIVSGNTVSSVTLLTGGSGYVTPAARIRVRDLVITVTTNSAGAVNIDQLIAANSGADVDLLNGVPVVSAVTLTSVQWATLLETAINSHTGTTGFSVVRTGTALDLVSHQTRVVYGVNVFTSGAGSPPGFAFNFFVGPVATFSTSIAGTVGAINVIAEGTGYTSAPGISIVPSTGVFVQFSSTGTLPVPLVQGNAYRAEGPSSSQGFTVKNADFSEVDITSTGSGNLFLVISRTFAIEFNNIWTGDFSGLVSANPVFFGTDYLFPITSPATTLTTAYYISKISDTTAKFYTDSGLTSLISVTQLGVGQSYFAVRVSAYAKAYNNLIQPADSQYLSTGMSVQFSSSGSLPYPLTPLTNYTIQMVGTAFSVLLSSTPIVFVNAGVPTLAVGQLSTNIIRTVAPEVGTTIAVSDSLYETGEQVSVRANTGDTLPNGLVASTYSTPQYYYARRISAALIELYDTLVHANNTVSTTGRINYYSTGNTVNSRFFMDSALAPTLVKSITHVEKPITAGYVSLYAFDFGRSNDMALIGQYHPTETNPKYRRIRIGQCCAWARILYRVAHPNITSVYDYIPLENERAILAAIHAVDLEDKDFMDQAQRYWAAAIGYLKNQNESMSGHAMEPPQINNLAFGDGSDPVMF